MFSKSLLNILFQITEQKNYFVGSGAGRRAAPCRAGPRRHGPSARARAGRGGLRSPGSGPGARSAKYICGSPPSQFRSGEMKILRTMSVVSPVREILMNVTGRLPDERMVLINLRT